MSAKVFHERSSEWLPIEHATPAIDLNLLMLSPSSPRRRAAVRDDLSKQFESAAVFGSIPFVHNQ